MFNALVGWTHMILLLLATRNAFLICWIIINR
jgi:hypothetical protein